jgi:flagellar motor protein MotB
MFKLIALYLIITKSISPKEFIRNPKSKHHHHQQKQRQQQEHYHVKDRHQFHLEQQQKHQHFKQQQHNVERMAVCIVLKLTLVAWDMWTYRNGF